MRVKPARPVLIRSHRLVRGLRVDIPIFERGGTIIKDSVCKTPLTLSTGVGFITGAPGCGIDFTTDSSDVSNTAIPTFQVNTSKLITVEVIFTRDSGGSGTNYGTLWGMSNGTGFGNRVWLMENDNASAGWGVTWQTWWESQPGIWSVPYPTVGELQHWFVTYNANSSSNDPVFWINGVKTTPTERLSPSGTYRGSANHLHLGVNSELGDSTWDGGFYLGRVWDRLLTDKEIRSLTADPWQIYVKQKQSLGMAAAVSSFIKTINGLAKASVKTINGLPIAQVKTWNGLP